MRRAGGDPQVATMRFDDRSADRKPHAKGIGFVREEGLEDALREGRIEPGPVSATALRAFAAKSQDGAQVRQSTVATVAGKMLPF
jgi:hypothetical protein